MHNFRLAMTEFETAVTADPRYFEAHANLGLAAQKAGNIERALSAYDSAMSINPTHADTRYNFALALYRGDYWFDAVQEAEKVVAVKPDHTSAHLLAAKIYSDNARNKTLARSHYLKVLEIDPRNSESASIKIWLSANPK